MQVKGKELIDKAKEGERVAKEERDAFEKGALTLREQYVEQNSQLQLVCQQAKQQESENVFLWKQQHSSCTLILHE